MILRGLLGDENAGFQCDDTENVNTKRTEENSSHIVCELAMYRPGYF